LTLEQAARVAAIAEDVAFQKDDALFHVGHPADTLYLLVEGKVALYHNVKEEDESDVRTAEALYRMTDGGANLTLVVQADGLFKQHLVGEIEPGQVVGISALIEPHRLTATARAACFCRLIKIDAAALRQLCASDAQLACPLLRAVARTTMERLHFARVQLTAQQV
jgi:CRP-like cAMP-binding protein